MRTNEMRTRVFNPDGFDENVSIYIPETDADESILRSILNQEAHACTAYRGTGADFVEMKMRVVIGDALLDTPGWYRIYIVEDKDVDITDPFNYAQIEGRAAVAGLHNRHSTLVEINGELHPGFPSVIQLQNL